MGMPYNRLCIWTDDCEFFDIPLSQPIRAVVAWRTIRPTFGGASRLGAPDELIYHQKGQPIAAKERCGVLQAKSCGACTEKLHGSAVTSFRVRLAA